ncbi:MAG: radical SAM protein [Nanoarchaeota archaeon]
MQAELIGKEVLEKRNVNILLINAIDEANPTVRAPLGLGYLASYLRKHGGPYNIKYSDRNIEATLREFKPNVVCISCVSVNYDRAKAIAKRIKEINERTITMIGGFHITLEPQSLDRNLDFGIMGEGEEIFCKIVESLFSNNFNIVTEEIKKISGVIFWDNGQLVINPGRGFVKDLDTIPPPDRELLGNHLYSTIVTSRGCVYKCVYCTTPNMWGNRVRFHSAEYVVNEIECLYKKYKPRVIYIQDDLFTINFPRIRKIVDLLKEKGLNKKIYFTFLGRSNNISEEFLEIVKDLKIDCINIGFETANQEILTKSKGAGHTEGFHHITVEDHINAIKLLNKYKIRYCGYFMIGFPWDTKETIMETYDFIKKYKVRGITFKVTPFPGTPLWDYSIDRGLVKGEDFSYSQLQHGMKLVDENEICLSEHLTIKELNELYSKFKKLEKEIGRKHILKDFMQDPKWAFNYYFNIVLKTKLFYDKKKKIL